MQFGLGRWPVRVLARAGFGMAVTAGAASVLAMSLTSEALAQEPLPGITVKGQKAAPRARPRPVQQQAAPEAQPQEEQPPVEQTAAQKERAAQEATYNVPAGVSVVGRSEIETFGSTNMDDVLRNIPGTWTRESPNNPGVAVNIRGFEGSGRVNMMIDGVRQNFRFTGHEAQGFVYVDPNLLAGVDIARGAVSTAGGAGALAGTANFRTLDVGDIIKYGQNAGVLTTATWGSNNVGWSEMFAAGARSGSVGIAGAISKRDSDNYKNGDGITVPFTDQDLISGLFKLEFTPSSEHFLKFGGVVYDNDFSANSYFQNVRSETFTMNYAYKPTDNPLVHLRFNAYRNDVTMKYIRGLNSVATSAVGRVIDDEGWGFDISNTSRFDFGAIKVKAEYGYELFRDDVDSINSATNATFGVNPSGTSQTSGAFSQTTFSYGITDLIVGLRYDMFKVDGSGAVHPLNPIGMPPGAYEVHRDDGRFNPKVTLAFNPFNWLQPYVTYSETMRSPTTSELLTGGTHPGSGGQSFFPNPFLEPEIAKGWEVGFNVKRDAVWTPYDIFRLKVAYFNLDVENYITACFGAPIPPSPAPTTYFCNNAGTSIVQGVELQAMYDTRYAFAGLGYTYTDSDLPSQSNGFGAQSYLPDHVLTLTGGLRFFDQKLTVGTRVFMASEAFVGLVNNPTDPYTDGYTLVDLFSSYKFDSGLELGATITNLFDVTYTPATSTPPSSTCGSFIPGVCPPGPDTGRGRTFLLTAKAQF